jgi:transcriptional regulator with XRE-family HTH domain
VNSALLWLVVQANLLFWQTEAMEQIEDVISQIGPRLRSARRALDLTQVQLSEQIGISVSTLSRLESGQRRATLEMLVPLARALSVRLDDLVAPPVKPSPRVSRKHIFHDGTRIVPLSGAGSGIQAFHHTIPANNSRSPDLRTHVGYEWLYVLSGRLRIFLGATELFMKTGESAEFDTQTPHWFGNGDQGPVEYISIFGPQGEKIHVRAKPRSNGD